MTRDQAIAIKRGCEPSSSWGWHTQLADALAALGLIKFEIPPDPFDVVSKVVGLGNTEQIFNALGRHGYKVVPQ